MRRGSWSYLAYFGVVPLFLSMGFAPLAWSNEKKSSGVSCEDLIRRVVETTAPKSTSKAATKKDQNNSANSNVSTHSSSQLMDQFAQFCEESSQLSECVSQQGTEIRHIESAPAKGKRILVFGAIHGDEPLSAEMALAWRERLRSIDPRNAWRIVPILNPDGLFSRSRVNANGVDLNRNFPTKDWIKEAEKYWTSSQKSDPRRFPGKAPASEPETRCAISHIRDFNPDFIVSIHTPYGVLDFDGPKTKFPPYKELPWRALGNFPGSLGRFMWKDHQLPVLTVEMRDAMLDPASLQDVLGGFAIRASKDAGAKPPNYFSEVLPNFENASFKTGM